jgi:hypothetical protein
MASDAELCWPLFLQLPLLILGPRLSSSWGSMVKTPQFLSMQTTW